MANPFITLGVPKELLLRGLSSGEFGPLRVLARGYYQALGKVYHPDRGGDAALMASFTTAFADIQQADDEELEFYIEELVDERDLRAATSRQATLDDNARRGATIGRLVHASAAIDQFAVLGVSAPQSLLCWFGDGRLVVLDVQSPHQVVARLAEPDSSPDPDKHSYDYAYEKGQWVARTLRGSRVVKRTPLRLLGQNRVSIIGGVSAVRTTQVSTSAGFTALESGIGHTLLRWEDPRTAWYMEHLSGNTAGGLVLTDAKGKYVTLTGEILARA
ncbi:MAG: hypothetical protein WAZ21_00115 [Candidatus Saccharimonadales bacterium]